MPMPIAPEKICTEPRYFDNSTFCDAKTDECVRNLQNWIEEMSAFLKSVAPNQLVAIGSEGFFGRGDPLAVHNPGGGTAEWVYQIGQDFAKNSAAKGIDYAEIHAWPDNWNNSDPDFLNNWVQAHMQSAQALGKPLVLEEFGKNVTDHLRATIARVRNPVFATLFATLNQSLASGGVLKGAQYWMADPSLTGPNSPGWANYSQDQVVPSESTMVEIIAPAARAAAAHAAPVPGCSPQVQLPAARQVPPVAAADGAPATPHPSTPVPGAGRRLVSRLAGVGGG